MREFYKVMCLCLMIVLCPSVATAEPEMAEPNMAPVVVDKVDINTADVETLSRWLAGVGQAKAEAIVAYRERHGRFQSVDDLMVVKGIGKSVLAQNRDRLRVD